MSVLLCAFKKCQETSVLDARIEVKTVLPTDELQKKIQHLFLVNWRSNGEAEFHVYCWEELLQLSRSRRTKGELLMIKEEKALIKVAAEAAEQFDSLDVITREAETVAGWIKQAQHCVAFTGAGISTSAGIGDYRGKAGKWTEEDQTNRLDMNSVFASSSEDPPQKKRRLEKTENESEQEEEDGVPYETLRPTYTHEALVKLMETGHLKYIISQNGDGLHGLSGVPKERISELHGNVFLERCELCGVTYDRKYYVMDDICSQYYEELEDYGKASVKKPRHGKKCERCGLSHRTGRRCEKKGCHGYLIDTIINFRDLLEEEILDKAKRNASQCDVMLCLGTTLQVTPAADLVKKMKDRRQLVICNSDANILKYLLKPIWTLWKEAVDIAISSGDSGKGLGQETPLDVQFVHRGPSGKRCGSRIFGDCDVFMKEVMKQFLSAQELQTWETGRAERMQKYNGLRNTT